MEPILIDTKIFDDVSLADICRVVYLNSNYKKNKIDNIIEKVKPLLQNVADVSIVLPILKEVLDISVKNDEQMVKLAAIVSRLLDTNERSKKIYKRKQKTNKCQYVKIVCLEHHFNILRGLI